MNRHDRSHAAALLPPDHPAADCLSEKRGLSEKLAHRALGEAKQRMQAPTLSAKARDRLYARMFPTHICLGASGDEPDPIS